MKHGYFQNIGFGVIRPSAHVMLSGTMDSGPAGHMSWMGMQLINSYAVDPRSPKMLIFNRDTNPRIVVGEVMYRTLKSMDGKDVSDAIANINALFQTHLDIYEMEQLYKTPRHIQMARLAATAEKLFSRRKIGAA